MAKGAPPSKVRLFNETHMTRVDDGLRHYVDDRASQVRESLEEHLTEVSRDEDGNSVPLSQEEKRIFLETVHASSHSRYIYWTRKNKTSSYHFDASTSTTTTSGINE
ncbi:uncharacterized protein LOC125370210 [Ricinus communis]|uniref:uncharacterized protein LOC125370210 n=1 Tax=Ricinus communis TaxID=3988 RepID=UPI00201A702F|nr:uncharacterized protein LOC125370210 [Ricinus communis]